ncbi:hypothetical protein [Actinomadura flavalba]|uniref:hypothetical protein n=1 Tax=Actinomadura flavalba TaxID=1120938 RepID=UPI0012DE9895|nr:hypothetical protein [Actinomadura flavalba]
MAADTGRDPDVEGLDQYWKRRVLALGGVLGAVGLLAWACSGGGGEPPKKEPVRNAAASASATPSPAIPTAMPTVTVTAQVTTTAPPPKRPGDACELRDVVVNLTSAKDVYAKGEQPHLQLSVVSTGPQPCTFDVGTRAMDVRIRSGSDRVWAASHCDPTSGSSIQMLRRGIPHVRTLTWDRRRTTDRCEDDRVKVNPGTYVAEVKAKGVKTAKPVFALR